MANIRVFLVFLFVDNIYVANLSRTITNLI